MLPTHERNQVYEKLLQPGAPTHESFLRKAIAALQRLHAYNWLVLGISLLCLFLALTHKVFPQTPPIGLSKEFCKDHPNGAAWIMAQYLPCKGEPAKCGKYQHLYHWPGACGPEAYPGDAVCHMIPPDQCVDDIHEVTEREWQQLIARLKALESK